MPDGGGRRLTPEEEDAQGWTPVTATPSPPATTDDTQGWVPVSSAPATQAVTTDDSQGWTPVAQAPQPLSNLVVDPESGQVVAGTVPSLSQVVAEPSPPVAPASPAPPVDPGALQDVIGTDVQADVPGAVAIPSQEPTPDPRQGFFGSLGAGGAAAMREGWRMTTGDTFTPQPPAEETPRTFMGEIGYGIGHSAPTLSAGFLGAVGGAATPIPGGALIGSGLGMGLMAAAQALAPAYDQAIKEGLPHDQAVDRAIQTAAVSGGISGLTAPIFAWAPFRSQVGNILLHTLGTAPAIGTAGRLGVPAVTGQPLPSPEQLATGAAADVVTGGALVGGHATARALTRPREFPTITTTGAPEEPGRAPLEPTQLPAPVGAEPVPPTPPGPVPGVVPPAQEVQPSSQPGAAVPAPAPVPVPPGVSPGPVPPIVPAPSTPDAAVDTPAVSPPPVVVTPPPSPPEPVPSPQPPPAPPGPTPSPAPPVEAPPTPTPDTTKAEGSPGSTRVVATAHPGIELPTSYEVVEADTLKPATGDLQPRDRAGRAASEAQIAENAARLDPSQITTSPVADYGAPVVMPDGTVLAGNGRLAAIQRAAELHPEKYQAYREELARLGHDVAGMNRPVLVRRTGDLTPDQARIFAEASNVPRAMTMSPVEQAKVDARNLSPATIAKYNPDVALTHGSNQGFIRDWMQSLPPTERNRVLDAQGQLSVEGLRRLQGAVLAKAYDHDAILRRALESPSDDVKSITGSLVDVAAPWVKLREQVNAGKLPDAFNITENITQALDLIQQARANGQSPADIINQADVFAGKLNPITEQIVRTFYNDRLDRLRSRKGITDALRGYVDEALAFKPGKDLLGDEAVADPAGALKRAREGGQPGLLDKAGPNQDEISNAHKYFTARAQEINKGTVNDAARRGDKPADGTLLWFLDGDKKVFANADGSDARLYRGDELAKYQSISFADPGGSRSRVWFKDGYRDQALQFKAAAALPFGPARDRALGLALGYAPKDVESYVKARFPDENQRELTAENAPGVRPEGGPSSERMATPDEGDHPVAAEDEQAALDAAFADEEPPTEKVDTATAKAPELQAELDRQNQTIAKQQARITELEAKGARLTPREARTLKSLKRQNALAVNARDQLLKRGGGTGGLPPAVARKRGRLVSPFKPKPPQAARDYADYQFRDGTSVWNQAFTDAGYDPNLAVNKPIAWQIQTLRAQTQKQFGLTSVEITPGMDYLQTRNILLDVYRASVDAMASLGYPHDALGLNKTVGLVLEPYTPKAEYAGMYDPNTRIIHLTGTANSLGHEWTHALDHWLLDQTPTLASIRAFPLASVHTAAGLMGNPNDSIVERFSKVIVTLFHDDADLALRLLHLERAAGQTDRFGNPTPAAVAARTELEELKEGVDTGTVKASRLREMSRAFGGGPGVDDYYGEVYEMLARSGEAFIARMMEDNAVDPRGVVMENGAYLADTVRRLKMTFPKDDEYLRLYEAWKLLHSAIQNKLFYDAPGGPFSHAGEIDLKKVTRLAQRTTPGAMRALRRGIMESAQALRHPIESWRTTALTDPTRPDPGDRGRFRRAADYGRKWFYTKVGALETMHELLPKGSAARAPIQKIIDKLGVSPGSGRSVGRTYEERAYFLAKDWTRQFANIMTNNGLTPKTFSLDFIRPNRVDQNAMLRHALVTGEDTYKGQPLPANVKAAAGPLRELSNAVFKANQDAGLDIAYAKNGHFMRMYDHPAVWADPDGFKADAHKLHTFMFNEDVGPKGDDPAALLKRWRDLSVEERGLIRDPQVGTNMQKLARNLVRQREITRELNDPASAKDKAKLSGDLQKLKDDARQLAEQNHDPVGNHIADLAAEAWVHRMVVGYPDDFDTVGPSGKYLNKRKLPPEADTIMEKWMVTDVNTVMPRYYLAAARKQASIEMFGARDAEFEDLLRQAREGGMRGDDAITVRAIKQAITGRPAGSNHGLGAAISWLHAFGTVTALGRSALTMASEPMVAGLATGDVRVAFKSVLNQLGAVMHTAGSYERAELADLMNVTTSALYDDIMLNRTGADYADSLRVDKLMGMYYRLNLMTQWNNGTRRASMAAHNWFLTKVSNDWGMYETKYGGAPTPPKGYAAARAHTRWDRANKLMNELGIPTDKETRKAFTEWMVSHDGMPSYEELETSNFTPIYQLAINRLVNRAVMNPTKADRPLIADSPYGMMMQFQSFNYAMGRQVVAPMFGKIHDDVARAYDRARGQGYSKTAAGAQAVGAAAMSLSNLAVTGVAFVVATALAAAVKLAIYANDVFQRHLDEGTLGEYLTEYALNQSGLAGALTMPINLYNDIRYSSSVSDAFAGIGLSSISQHVHDIMLAITGMNTPETETNTHAFNATKAAYNLLGVPLFAVILSKLAGGFGPVVAGMSTLSFASLSSRPFSDAVAKFFFGEKGTPKPDQDKEEALEGLPPVDLSEDEKEPKPAADTGGGGGAILGVLDDFVPSIVRSIGPYAMAIPGPVKYAIAAGLAAWGGINFWQAGEPYRNAPPPVPK